MKSTLSSLARTVLKLCAPNSKKCGSRVHLTATPLPWRRRAKRVVMYLPTYLPTDQKRFSDFAQNFLRWSSSRINLFKFGKFWIPIFPIGKKSNFVWNFFSKSLWGAEFLMGTSHFFNILMGSRIPYADEPKSAASLARTVLKLCAPNSKKCGSRVFLAATPLPWQPKRSVVMDLLTYLPPSRSKKVLWFYSKFCQMKFK